MNGGDGEAPLNLLQSDFRGSLHPLGRELGLAEEVDLAHDLPADQRMAGDQRVLVLRQALGLFANLRPVAPPEGEAWADPDRPRRPQMVDAALDAMVALAVEAATRPDPHEQLTARIGRAARRLRRP